MEIILYNINEKFNKLNKTLGTGTTISGELVGRVDLLNPVIKLVGHDAINYNYCYIADFNRYYYFTSPPDVEGHFSYIKLHSDVLMNFADDIKNSSGYIRRSNRGNAYIVDNLVLQSSKKKYQIKKLGETLQTNVMYVVVTGGK